MPSPRLIRALPAAVLIALLSGLAAPARACDELPLDAIAPGQTVLVPDLYGLLGYCNTRSIAVPDAALLDLRAPFSNLGDIQVQSGASLISRREIDNGGGIQVAAGGSFLNLGGYGGIGPLRIEAGGQARFAPTPGWDNVFFGEILNAGQFDLAGELNARGDFGTYSGTTLISGTLRGYAAVDLSGGGSLSVTGGLQVRTGGRATLQGGSLQVAGALEAHDGGEIWLGNAELSQVIQGSGVLNNASGRVTVVTNGALQLAGRLYNGPTANLTVAGGLGMFPDSGNSPRLENWGRLEITPTGRLYITGELINRTHAVLTNHGELAVNSEGGVVNDGEWTNDGALSIFDRNPNLPGPSVSGSGSFTQTGGSLRLDGLMQQSAVRLLGGSLCGHGRVDAPVYVNHATLCPGNSPGRLTLLQGLEFVDGVLALQIAGSGEGQYDVLEVLGAASFTGGQVVVSFIDGFVPAAGEHWQLLRLAGPVSGLDQLASTVQGLPAGLQMVFDPIAGGIVLQTAAVPEPGAALLWLAGLGGLGLWVRRARPGN